MLGHTRFQTPAWRYEHKVGRWGTFFNDLNIRVLITWFCTCNARSHKNENVALWQNCDYFGHPRSVLTVTKKYASVSHYICSVINFLKLCRLRDAPTSLTLKNCTLCPHCINVFCIYLRKNSYFCHLRVHYNLDESVYCAVRTGTLNKVFCHSSLKGKCRMIKEFL
jgi:hypothetical protein